MEIKTETKKCLLCSKDRAHNSIMCKECRAFIDMTNTTLATFTPSTLGDFISTMHHHDVENLTQLEQLAQERNASQLAGMAKRLKTSERTNGGINMFPRLLRGLQVILDHTNKKQAEAKL